MSELFGKDVSEHIAKTNVMKDDFGWEVPYETVPIPSNGIIYNPDSDLYNLETVQIKAMTAKEEDILASQALIKEGTIVTNLIKSCVVNASINPEEMIAGDRNAIMISIRITGYGVDYPYTSVCNNCGHKNKNTAKLDSLPIKRLEISPVESGKNEFEYQLPVTKKKITFKFLTDKDDKDREAAEKFIKKHTEAKVENRITSFLEYSILSVDGIRDRNKIKHFVMHMPAFDSKSLRKFINQNEPGIDMSQSYECTECGSSNDINLPVTAEFFWPST
tara:strand:+ start:275 stop:1102 length:828 start_codon:yes stop_codon:yes gene_type:complete